MGCWVVPTIAAEFWRVSLEHVMEGVRTGAIPSKSEDGFLFVGALPNSPTPADVAAAAPTRRTYVEVPCEDRPAHVVDERERDGDGESDGDGDNSYDADADDNDDEGDFEEEFAIAGDWRLRRQQAGTLRRAPVAR